MLAGENSTTLSSGVGDRTMESRRRSEELLTNAEDALRRTAAELQPRLAAAQASTQLINDLNQRTADGLTMINTALDQSGRQSEDQTLRSKASEVAAVGSEAMLAGTQAAERITKIADQIPITLEKSKQMVRDMDTATKAVTQALVPLERLNELTPDLIGLVQRADRQMPVLKTLGSDIEVKLAELRHKIAVARDQANRIKVGVTLYRNSTLQLRNPEGLSRAATSNRLSFFFRTAERDGFLAYLGNPVGSNKKLRRVSTDDFMALEVRKTTLNYLAWIFFSATASVIGFLFDFFSISVNKHAGPLTISKSCHWTQVHNGYLTLLTDLGAGPQFLTNERYVSDDVWYQAIVERTGKSVRLSVRFEKEAGLEETVTKDAVLPGTFSILNLDQDVTKLLIGGYQPTDGIQPVVKFASFQGQIEQVKSIRPQLSTEGELLTEEFS